MSYMIDLYKRVQNAPGLCKKEELEKVKRNLLSLNLYLKEFREGFGMDPIWSNC